MMRRLGLRARMAASYVLVTAAAVLAVEGVLLGLFVPRLLSGSDLAKRTQDQTATDAKNLSLVATKISSSGAASDQDVLMAVAKEGAGSTPIGGSASDPRGVRIPLTKDRRAAALEALIDVSGTVYASSAPGTYPPGSRLAVDWRSSGGTGTAKSPQGMVAWAVSPVITGAVPLTKASPSPMPPGGKGFHEVGMLYVQVPTTEAYGPSLAALRPALAAGAGVLGLIVPVGVLFGLLSTGRVILRLRRLADATVAVAAGDFRPRVPVEGQDEIGRLEDSLNRMAAQLDTALDAERRLAGAGARQAERARIARELHDSISQDLFSMSLLAGGLRRALPEGSSLRPEAAALERTAARAMREMQALLLELRPVALEDAGLLPAVEELCRAYEIRLGVRVRAELEPVALDPPAEHAVLRVVQEALGNAVKHAAAGAVHVRISLEGDAVSVAVSDDGEGFEPDQAARRHGMGLALMRERVEELGGRFAITSGPRTGTTVRAWLPAASATGEGR